MKSRTRLIAFLLVSVITLSLMPISGLAASTALKGKTIIAFGDSLTAQGGTKTYPYYLSTSDYLGVNVINAGVGGDSTRHLLARFQTDVLSKDPDVVILCIGRNDQACLIASGVPNVPFDEFRENITYITNELKKIGCEVVFVTPQPVVVGDGYYPEGGGDYGLDYGYGYEVDFCDITREVALDTGSTFVDIFYESEFIDLLPLVASDGIHHTDLGRQKFARYISDHMLAVYDNQSKATMTVNCVDENGKTIRTYTVTGKSGAHITIPTPDIKGYTTDDADIPTTYVNGKTFTFTYSFVLEDLVDEAMSYTYEQYGRDVIALVRDTIDEANALIADDSASTEAILDCSERLSALIDIKGDANIPLSTGASYVTTAPNRNDTYDDDGIQLTDGIKAYPDGREGYSGWSYTTVEVTVDLGKTVKADCFSVYAASGMWGIKRPNKLTVSVSTDGSNYTAVGTQTALKNIIETASGWDISCISVLADTPVEARYVKFTIPPNGNFVWIGETEVSLSPDRINNGIYVSGINEKISEGSCVVFTDSFGTITLDSAAHGSTANVIAEWNEEKSGYTVTEIGHGIGANTADITLESGEIMISADINADDYTSIANYKKLRNLNIGDTLMLDGIDVEGATREFASHIVIADYKGDADIDGETFWVTHYNTKGVEGAGTIFTSAYDGCGWWAHVSFKPVAGLDNVYEVVAKDLTGNGLAQSLEIPEGGFVWACNSGNNYIELNGGDDNYINYLGENGIKAVALAKAMNIGDKYIFSGLNLDTRTVPTTTPHIDYFAPEYICTAKYALYEAAAAVSQGKDYTVTSPNRNDGWDDDGIRLTDGVKGTPDGGATADGKNIYAGWNSKDKTKPNVVEVIIDLGESVYTDTYTVYLAGGAWGISLPMETVSVEAFISDSVTGEFISVASAPVGSARYLQGRASTDENLWTNYSITATADRPVEARYIKLVITHMASGNGIIWMDEVEADLVGDPNATPEPEYALGDVNADGEVNSADYLIVKRVCFGSYTLSAEEAKRANIDGSSAVDSVDYVLVKRIAFDTYSK